MMLQLSFWKAKPLFCTVDSRHESDIGCLLGDFTGDGSSWRAGLLAVIQLLAGAFFLVEFGTEILDFCKP